MMTEADKKKKALLDELDEINKSQLDSEVKKTFEKLVYESVYELNEKASGIKKELDLINNKNINVDDFKRRGFAKQNAGLKVGQQYYFQGGDMIYPNSVQQNVPGWTIFALFWIVQTIVINIISERQTGAYKRILLSPVTGIQFIAGKIIPFFIINMLQAFVMFGLFILTASISFVAICFGLLISSFSRTLFLAASLSASIVIIMTVLGGIMVPKFLMPLLMQKLSMFVPQGWALDGYLNIIVKNSPIMKIVPNVLVLFGFGILFLIISLVKLKFSERE
jgi:ABC-type multidrug transport system permease subunit